MKHYKGFLIDLDGTMYRGEEKIPYAKEFIKYLQKAKLPFLFITNNSTRTKEQCANKLKKFDIHVSKENILTSAIASAKFLQTKQLKNGVFAIGEKGLFEALMEENISLNDNNPDYVLVGLDKEVNYNLLTKASIFVQKGAKLIATNKDLRIPHGEFFHPSNGALVKVIESTANTKATFIGKPEKEMMNQALKQLNLSKEDVLMVGDNYETDILFGINNGVDTLHVQTGVTSKEDLKTYNKQPTYTIPHLGHFLAYKKDV